MKMNGKKVFVIGADNYANWLPMEVTDKIEEADLILFTGGEDVDPRLYGDTIHPSTNYSCYRDNKDTEHYNYAVQNDIPMLGICRGSQFLTAMQKGGRIIQDVENHAIWGTHEIEDIHGNILEITSTHHQMHYLLDMNEQDYELIAWSKGTRPGYYALGDELLKPEEMEEGFKESEIVYFPKCNALAIQGHAEMLEYEHPTNIYLRKLVEDKLF